MKTRLSLWLSNAWYRDAHWLYLLEPLSRLFGAISALRRKRILGNPKLRYRAKATVIVIGNITAGGTGKTPLTLALAQILAKHQVKLAIVSRGHGGHSKRYPLEVTSDSDPAECGDEALIYATRAGCPVVVDPNRVRAVQWLEAKYKPLLILCDDGLQHYTLERDLEIAVIDGKRGLGNGWLLPRGPLREPAERLQAVDVVVINGKSHTELPEFQVPEFTLRLQPRLMHNLATGTTLGCDEFLRQYPGKVHALAGIGNPERFFNTLTTEGFAIITHVFNDHHNFRPADLEFPGDLPLVMTEKDAVKCRAFATTRHWYLSVDAVLPEGLLPHLLGKLVEHHHASNSSAAH